MSDKPVVGIVGVGLLGSAVARVLLEAGYQIVAYDVAADRLAEIARRGARPVASAAEVARSAGPVFTLLPTLETLEQAITGGQGVLAGARGDTVVIQMSTILPELAVRMGEAARARGAELLDAPVSGTSAMVARRDCAVTVAGDRPVFDRCRPVLEALARRVFYVGDRLGSGTYLKLATNLVMALNCVVVAEGMTLARRAGLDPGQMVEILSHGAATSRMLEVRGPLMAEHRFEPMSTVDLNVKDLRLILSAAQGLHVPLPLTGVAQQLLIAAQAAGRSKEDLAAVVCVYEAMAGVDPAGGDAS